MRLFDANLTENPEEIISELKSNPRRYLVIYDDGFNYLTKMCLTKMREAAFQLAKIGKAHGCKVMVCSSDSSDHFEDYLNEGADYVLFGEGEDTLKELVHRLDNSEDVSSVRGIAYNENGFVKTERRPVLTNLDALPRPAWDLIDIERYKKIWTQRHGQFSLNIATTRGCPFKCNWCAKPIYGNRYNSRSPEKVADEIEFLLAEYQPDHFWMCDDIFGLKPGWVQRFRDIVLQRELNFKFKIQSRVDLLLQEDTIDALVDSGLETVWVGAESGSQKILDAMDKGTTVDQIRKATQLLKRKGVKVAFFLQFGYLGEGKEDIDNTIEMVMELMPDDIGVSVSYPLPGTKFYEKVKADLKQKQNWTDSDDLDMMYQSTYNAEYYKQLHRYVHKQFRKHQGFQNLKRILRNPFTLDYSKARSALLTMYYIPTAFADNIRLKKLQSTHAS